MPTRMRFPPTSPARRGSLQAALGEEDVLNAFGCPFGSSRPHHDSYIGLQCPTAALARREAGARYCRRDDHDGRR